MLFFYGSTPYYKCHIRVWLWVFKCVKYFFFKLFMSYTIYIIEWLYCEQLQCVLETKQIEFSFYVYYVQHLRSVTPY